MKKRFLALAGAGVLAVVVVAATFGVAAADGPGPGGRRGPDPATMTRLHQNGPYGVLHEQTQAAVAGALGITVEELQAELAAGKAVAVIAQERGVDFATVQAAVQTVHQAAGLPAGPGMPGRGAGGGRMGPPAGAGTGVCPYAGN